jgi:rod shape-determining protein MreC
VRYLTVGRPESQRRDLLLAAGLCLAALLLSSLGLQAQLAITLGLRSTVLAPFLAAHRMFERSADLAERVALLSAERDSLAVRELRNADLGEENRQLRVIVGLPGRVVEGFAVGEVIAGASESGGSHSFLFRVGPGVALDLPAGVSSPRGLVGVLRSARGRTGLGEFWTHPDFRVAVRAADLPATGIVRPVVAESGEILMLLEGVPYQTDVPDGSLLLTSGIGGVHPSGIPVGTVLEERESSSGWSHSYLVQPAVRPGLVRVGLVWLPALPDSSAANPEPGAEGD